MLVLDVNVLLALHRSGHVHHEAASKWWRGAVDSGTTVTAPDLVTVGFVRIATHRRVFDPPSTTRQAFDFLRSLHQQPTFLPLAHLPDLVRRLEVICLDHGVRADLVPDAYLAAVASRLGAGVVTFDRDFRRFDGLRLVELG